MYRYLSDCLYTGRLDDLLEHSLHTCLFVLYVVHREHLIGAERSLPNVKKNATLIGGSFALEGDDE